MFELLGQISLLGLGIAGLVGAMEMPRAAAVALTATGAVLAALHVLSVTFVAEQHTWPGGDTPQPLRIGPLDYGKALVAWFLGFRRTYAVAPGLYFTGDHYDIDAPLLVTSNYHLTVFLVARRIRAANARLLVIDTGGINVWCAAGKGRFSNEEILRQLDRYPRELLSRKPRPTLILPKFGMSGVQLRTLRKQGLRPIVGPLYAKDLPAYLASPPLRNRAADRVDFRFGSRVFVWLPGLLQTTALAALLTSAIWLSGRPWGEPPQLGIVAIVAALTTAYAWLFPLIPGTRFASKGLLLGILFSGALLAVLWASDASLRAMAFAAPFTLAAGMLIGLEFTGNSAVSNYSRVKREVATFLPISALLLVVSAGAFIVLGVLQ